MSNIILLICCISVGFLVGNVFRKQCVWEADLFGDAVKYVATLKLNVAGRRVELAQFNQEFLLEASDAFRCYMQGASKVHLSSERKKHLQNFFTNVDCASAEQLLQHLDFYHEIFLADFEVCRQRKKTSAVYVKLGLLCGAMVGVLFL